MIYKLQQAELKSHERLCPQRAGGECLCAFEHNQTIYDDDDALVRGNAFREQQNRDYEVMFGRSLDTRLEYLRGELRAERISYDELLELQSLAEHIDPGDVELLEAAGIEEARQ